MKFSESTYSTVLYIRDSNFLGSFSLAYVLKMMRLSWFILWLIKIEKKIPNYASETEVLQLTAVGSSTGHWHCIAFSLEYQKLQHVWKVDLIFLCMFSHLSGGSVPSGNERIHQFPPLLCPLPRNYKIYSQKRCYKLSL